MTFHELMDYLDSDVCISKIHIFLLGEVFAFFVILIYWGVRFMARFNCERRIHLWKKTGTFGKHCRYCKLTWKDYLEENKKSK